MRKLEALGVVHKGGAIYWTDNTSDDAQGGCHLHNQLIAVTKVDCTEHHTETTTTTAAPTEQPAATPPPPPAPRSHRQWRRL